MFAFLFFLKKTRELDSCNSLNLYILLWFGSVVKISLVVAKPISASHEVQFARFFQNSYAF
jgi:hypothetical protein